MKQIIRHTRIDTPSYILRVNKKPPTINKPRSKTKKVFGDVIRKEARSQISTPMVQNDIEIEIIYSTRISKGVPADIDNIIKPIVDTLKDIAYNDDSLVRSVSATKIDLTEERELFGLVEHMVPMIQTPYEHNVLISIYSDSRLKELGGADHIEALRAKQFEKERLMTS